MECVLLRQFFGFTEAGRGLQLERWMKLRDIELMGSYLFAWHAWRRLPSLRDTRLTT
jgi:hypothetical protein